MPSGYTRSGGGARAGPDTCRRVTFEEFLANEEKQWAVIRGIEIIGEASTKVSRDFVAGHPDLPWKQMRDMRHVLIHAYAEVDMSVVWDVVQNDLPRPSASLTWCCPVEGTVPTETLLVRQARPPNPIADGSRRKTDRSPRGKERACSATAASASRRRSRTSSE